MGCTHQSGGIINAFDDSSLRKESSRLRTKGEMSALGGATPVEHRSA